MFNFNHFYFCFNSSIIILDIWATPFCPDNITDQIAAISLNPKVEILVNTTLKDGHTITVKELKTIIKEKIRMLK